MADTTAGPPKQSKEYKNKAIAQIIVSVGALIGFDVQPEDLIAILAGIEGAYLVVRRYFRKGA